MAVNPNKFSWVAVSLTLALASYPATGLADAPLAPGIYLMRLTEPNGAGELSCSSIKGTADAMVEGRAIVTPFFKSLELGVERNGSVMGGGSETLTGWNFQTNLTGTQTNSGYSGEYELSPGAGRGVQPCSGKWQLLRGMPLESGTYLLTIRSKEGRNLHSCKNLDAEEEISIEDGRGSPGTIAGLRVTAFPDGSVSARGFETAIYSMPIKLTGNQAENGYEGEFDAKKVGYQCQGVWSLRKRKS